MDLADLIEDHNVMRHIVNDQGLSEQNVLLSITYDVDLYKVLTAALSYMFYVTIFNFKREVKNTSDMYILYNHMYFTDTVSWNGDSGTHIYYILKVMTQVNPDKIRVQLFRKVDGGTAETSSQVDLDPNTNYALVSSFSYYSSNPTHHAYWGITVRPVDADGNFGSSVVTLSNSMVISNFLDYIDYFKDEVRLGYNFDYNIDIFEMDLSITDWSYPIEHRLFKLLERKLDFTYYTTNWRHYMFPPKEIFEGTPYDKTQVLYDYIADLEDYVDTLETSMATLTTKISALETELLTLEAEYSEGSGPIATWFGSHTPAWWDDMPLFARNICHLILDLLDEVITSIQTWFSAAKDAVLPGGSIYNWIDTVQDTLTSGGILYNWLEGVQITLATGGTIYDWLSNIKIPFDLSGAQLLQLKKFLSEPLSGFKCHIYKFIYQIINGWRNGT